MGSAETSAVGKKEGGAARRPEGNGGKRERIGGNRRELEGVHDNPVDPLFEFSVTNNKLADKVADYPGSRPRIGHRRLPRTAFFRFDLPRRKRRAELSRKDDRARKVYAPLRR